MSKNIRKTYTDNPLLDQIIYEVKGMIADGIILMDTDEADKNETIESLKMADRYAQIIEGHPHFEFFDYTKEQIMRLPYMSKETAMAYSINKSMIPEPLRPQLLKIACDDFLASYEEQNNYYRMLYGLPNYKERGIHLTQKQIALLKDKSFNIGKYIHEMDNSEIRILEIYGILDEIKQQYPDKKYLWHLGERRIDPYIARRTPRFGLLYLPPCDSNEVYKKFNSLLVNNRALIINTLYSEAYKYQSDYYDKFMMIMIIIQSFVDMIVLSPEYIISRELFDMRTIQYVFESQGVKFFPDIPLKYQKRLVKNLNRLIKFKSCDKNLIDIASLFGFEDVGLFKYWILKDPIMNGDGTYRHDTYEDPKTGEDKENVNANYQLKFIKVPLDGIAEEALMDKFNILDYDDMVEDDVYWNGIYTKEYVKTTILEHEFNMCMSKYIGMETTCSMAELSMQLCYLINMIMYSVDTTEIKVSVPEISTTHSFSLIDLLITLYSLGYLYRGIEDNIIYDPVRSMAVCGFNFDVDMNKLADYVAEKDFTLEELGVDGFVIPKDGIFSFDQLLEIYTNNKNIYKHLAHEIINANDKDIYDIYKKIFDSLMYCNLNFDYFTQFGVQPKTYKEFLEMKSGHLYSIILECSKVEKLEDRRIECTKYVDYITQAIEIYLDSDEFKYIFHGIPTASVDFIRKYLFEVLNFFKSYMVDFTHVNMVYVFDDRLDNRVQIIDRVLFSYMYEKKDIVSIEDFIKYIIHMEPKESVQILEKIAFDITRWNKQLFKSKVEIIDLICEILIKMAPKEYIQPIEKIRFTYTLLERDMTKTVDGFGNVILHITFRDSVDIEEIASKKYK